MSIRKCFFLMKASLSPQVPSDARGCIKTWYFKQGGFQLAAPSYIFDFVVIYICNISDFYYLRTVILWNIYKTCQEMKKDWWIKLKKVEKPIQHIIFSNYFYLFQLIVWCLSGHPGAMAALQHVALEQRQGAEDAWCCHGPQKTR